MVSILIIPIMLYQDIIAEFKALENPTKAKLLSGFFKTDTGQYGE